MHTFIIVIAVLAIALQALRIAVAFFGPSLKYRLGDAPGCPLDSPYFRSLVSALAQAELQLGNRVEVIENGENFYPAELAATLYRRLGIDTNTDPRIRPFIGTAGPVAALV